jgi:tRNA 2-selenouridine synthase
VVLGWCESSRAGRTREVVRQLLEMHYDPGYAQSTRRNYARFEQATEALIDDISPAGLARVAQQLVAGT